MSCCKPNVPKVRGKFNVSIVRGDLPRTTGFNARTFPRSVTLARFVPTGTGGSTGTFQLQGSVYTPSNRLRLAVVAAFEADNPSPPDPAFVVQPTWSIRSMSRNPENGKEVPLQLAYPAPGGTNTVLPLPDAYELDSAVKLLRVDLTVTDTAFSIAYVPATASVNLVLYATWEPNTPISDEERDYLYQQCSLSATPPKLITNTAT